MLRRIRAEIRGVIKWRLRLKVDCAKRFTTTVHLALLCSISFAYADTAHRDASFGDWIIACTSLGDKNAHQGLECTMSQRVEFEDTSEPLMQLDLYLNPETAKPEAVFIMPLGIPLSSSPVLLFDNSTRLSLKISHCYNDGCYFKTPLNEALLESFLSMRSATVKLIGNGNETVNIPISGSGSRAAYNYFKALPKD
jgi:invasion protein IalB